jgi:hypothetical protein
MMLSSWYANWMVRWETALTTRDENRIVRPMEWGFDWLRDILPPEMEGFAEMPETALDPAEAERAMEWLNRAIVAESDGFFGYVPPQDYRLELRHPELFPTNVRPETLAQDAELKAQAARGEMETAEFLRFTSPVSTGRPASSRARQS